MQTTQAPELQPSALVRLFAWIEERHRRWYASQIHAHRHTVEEDARRLGGRVFWDDVQ